MATTIVMARHRHKMRVAAPWTKALEIMMIYSKGDDSREIQKFIFLILVIASRKLK